MTTIEDIYAKVWDRCFSPMSDAAKKELEEYETLADYQKEYPCSCISYGGSAPCSNCSQARSGAVTIKEFETPLPDEEGYIPKWMKDMS